MGLFWLDLGENFVAISPPFRQPIDRQPGSSGPTLLGAFSWLLLTARRAPEVREKSGDKAGGHCVERRFPSQAVGALWAAGDA